MKKKCLLAVVAMSLLVAVGLTGCAGTSVSDQNASSASGGQSVSSMAISEIKEDNLSGMLTYLKGNGVIKEDTKEMKAEMIGAIEGKMIEGIYGNNSVFMEIYEFDLNNLNEKANKVLLEAKQDSKFTSLDGQLNAALSNNGRFLILYKDVYTDDTNGPIQERILKLFKEFAPTVTASSDTSSEESAAESMVSSDVASSEHESTAS